MNLRERQELFELEYLSEFAAKSKNSTRKIEEEPCDVRTYFQRDRDRILHSKAFRRLMHKTQVFISPEGDHYRTRLTHTLEVSQISRTIAKALMLNEDLTEAIALGHDLGHTPFGHAGEDSINRLLPNGFRHNEQSVRVVEFIENKGRGLNLSNEVLDGILNHRTSCKPSTLEGEIVRLSDKIAYINHDSDDAIRCKILTMSDFPKEVIDVLGEKTSDRIDTLIRSVIENSKGKNSIGLEPNVKNAMGTLRKFLFQNVYKKQLTAHEKYKIDNMIKQLFDYYLENKNELEGKIYIPVQKNFDDITKDELLTVICDYVAGMTDRYVINKYSELFIPETFHK